MILSTLAITIAIVSPQDAKTIPVDTKAVSLSRVFPKNEKLVYGITSNLHIETRPYGLQTFLPEDLDLNYKFTTEVKELKADGIALLHYTRPTMVQIAGETYNAPSKTTVEKVDMNYDLTVSPINQILEIKDLNPPKKKTPPKKQGGGDGDAYPQYALRASGRQSPLGGLLNQFIGEVYRLALNVGSMDSALDFSPKLPLDDVKVGETWKTTVSYQPQKLKGKDGKQAVQRLDYTFTYKGVVTVNGKQYQRVNAALDLNTDLGAFVNQVLDAKPEQTGLKDIPLTLKQSIDYDLDMTTKRTMYAKSKAEGGFKINITQIAEPVQEEKLTGSTEMRLLSVTTSAPVKASTKGNTKGGKNGGSH
jgi:hypothetical protein